LSGRDIDLEIARLQNTGIGFGVANEAIKAIIKKLPIKPGLPPQPIKIEPSEIKKVASELKPIFTELENTMKEYGENLLSMVSNPAILFYTVVDLMFYRSLVRWPEKIKDKDQLAQIYSVVYSKISEIQLILSEFIRSIKVSALDPIGVMIMGRKQNMSLGGMITFYYKLGLSQEIERVKESIVKINQDINELELIDINLAVLESIKNPDRISDTIAELIFKNES
jgi:hypothetical protein